MLDNWSHLPDLQFRTLLRMAHTALDKEKDGKQPNLYWAGHEKIARTWRQPFPDGDDDESARRRRNILNDVRRTMRGLESAGAVKPIDDGIVRAGHAQTYLLLI